MYVSLIILTEFAEKRNFGQIRWNRKYLTYIYITLLIKIDKFIKLSLGIKLLYT